MRKFTFIVANVLFTSFLLSAQSQTMQGKEMIKRNPCIGVATDVNGGFCLNVSAGSKAFVVSYVESKVQVVEDSQEFWRVRELV